MSRLALFTENFRALGSENEIQLYAENAVAAQRMAGIGIEEARRIEAKYSRYLHDSLISRINRAAGISAVSIDAETASLLDYADTCYRLSNGVFDPCSGVLRRVWDFKRGLIPEAADIAALLPLIAWNEIERDGQSIRLPKPGMELDFGGIGKEYCADRVAGVLVGAGARHGLVNLGGDIRVIGPHPDGKPWAIGIRHPRIDGRALATINIASGALATSGDYERFFERDGQRYCHLLDARTGYPVDCMQSVSVAAPLCTVAGSACTMAMLKQDGGLRYLQSQEFPWLAADRHGTLHGNLAPQL